MPVLAIHLQKICFGRFACASGELAHDGGVLLAGVSGDREHVHVEHRRLGLSLQF